jgi:Domain of unknown function (DUF4192)
MTTARPPRPGRNSGPGSLPGFGPGPGSGPGSGPDSRPGSGPSRRSARPTLRLREPADVLAAIPYLVGFHPSSSVVTLALRGKQLVFSSRGDLPTHDDPPALIRDAVDQLVRVVSKQRADAAILVGYGPEQPVRPTLKALRTALERRRVEVREMLRVEGDRYWSLFCDAPSCCPPEGSRFNATSSEVAATATLLGMAVLPDRDSFQDQLRPVDGISRVSMAQATDRAHERLAGLLGEAPEDRAVGRRLREASRAAVVEALDRTRQGGRLDDDEAAWLSTLLAAAVTRDGTWRRLFRGSELDVHRSLWLDLFRRAEPELRAAPGCFFAYAAWRTGDAAIASIALDHVLRIEPGHRLAREFGQAIRGGMSPSIMDSLGGSPLTRPRARRGRRRSSSGRAGSQRR